jgi:hypothetical protein
MSIKVDLHTIVATKAEYELPDRCPHCDADLTDDGALIEEQLVLAEPDLNVGAWKNPVGIYRAIARGEVLPVRS